MTTQRHRVRVRKADGASAAATEPESPTNRLSGITVNEVSIVDRAANERKFLVVKAGPPGAPPAAAPAAPPPAAPPPAAPPPAVAWSLDPALKAKLVMMLKTASDKITAISARVQTATDAPGGAAPPDLMSALAELAGLFTAKAADGEPKPESGDQSPEATTKAGRKMSAARLKDLQGIKTTLDALIAEVSDAKGDDDGDASGSGAGDTQTTKTTKSEGTDPPEPVAAPELAEIKTAVQQMGDTLDKMTRLFEGQNARIEALSKSTGTSRQVDLDKAGPRKQADKPVVWGIDMNKPMEADPPAARKF